MSSSEIVRVRSYISLNEEDGKEYGVLFEIARPLWKRLSLQAKRINVRPETYLRLALLRQLRTDEATEESDEQ